MAHSQEDSDRQSAAARLQKSSLKDLVNRFNAAGDAPPPVPPSQSSRSTSASQTQVAGRSRYRKRPSDITAQTQSLRDLHSPNQVDGSSSFQLGNGWSSPRGSVTDLQHPTHVKSLLPVSTGTQLGRQAAGNFPPVPNKFTRQPLFGEIVSDSLWATGTGYGVATHRPRRGSDGSMHHPNPMFPHTRSQSNLELSPSSPTAWYLGVAYQSGAAAAPEHRRTRSDFVGASVASQSPASSHEAGPSSAPQMQEIGLNMGQSWRQTPSKIPVSMRKQSLSSDTGSPSAFRTRRSPHLTTSVKMSPNNSSTGSPVSPSSHANLLNQPPKTPPATLSSKRYNGNFSKSPDGNPSLKAYITAPVPAKSPPLRSSRPRQPVSTASNSGHRATSSGQIRVSMSRETSGQGNELTKAPESKTRKIPELGGLDFAARRDRMMKALGQNNSKNDLKHNRLAAERTRTGHSRREQEKENIPHGLFTMDMADDAMRPPPSDYEGRDMKHKLSVAINGRRSSVSPDMTMSVTDIEDDSPTLGMPGSFPLATDVSFESEGSNGPGAHTESSLNGVDEIRAVSITQDDVHLQPADGMKTILSSIAQIRARTPSSVADDQSPECGEHETIQIMLSHTPVPPEQATQWHSGVHDDVLRDDNVSDERRSMLESTPSLEEDDRSLRHADGEGPPAHLEDLTQHTRNDVETSPATTSGMGSTPERNRSTLGNEAYSTVNRVLEHYYHPSVVTPQMVHSFQEHILKASPDLAKGNGWKSEKLAKFYLQELATGRFSANYFASRPEEYEVHSQHARKDFNLNRAPSPQQAHSDDETTGTAVIYQSAPYADHQAYWHSDNDDDNSDLGRHPGNQRGEVSMLRLSSTNSASSPDPSLPSLEQENLDYKPTPPPKDWQFPGPRSAEGANVKLSTENNVHTSGGPRLQLQHLQSAIEGLGLAINVDSQDYHPTSGQPPLPDHSPPPPPMPASREGASSSAHNLRAASPAVGSADTSTYFTQTSGEQRASGQPPVTHWAPSITSRDSSLSPKPQRKVATAHGPTEKEPSQPAVPEAPAGTESPTPDQRRLIKRRLIVKEIVDTEKTFCQDMSVVEDIYKATSMSPKVLKDEDRRVLFGNSDQILRLSTAFSDSLKQAAASIYTVPRSSRWPRRGSISTSNSAVTEPSSSGAELVDEHRDRKTFIGRVFVQHMASLERVYGDYLKNHDAANNRLLKIQNQENVKHWLEECKNNCRDITTAWNLDSLLIKPTQRILKYPLLLRSLLDVTPEDHPDYSALHEAVHDMTEASRRINDSKKRADLVEVVSRKRNPSDVRIGFPKVIGRRAEKIKQHVGWSESVDDPNCKAIAQQCGGHFLKLQIVLRDVDKYISTMVAFVDRCNAFVVAMEALIDVGQSDRPEIESKWRKFARLIRDLTAVALPEHRDVLQRKVCEPIVKAIKMYENAQRLIKKRKKRIVDYAKYKNVQERGEKPEKKTLEQAEQYLALNDALKDELPKLYSSTKKLINACLNNFVEIQLQWQLTWRRKLSLALEEQQRPPEIADILTAFSSEFEYAEAQVLSLGICNGSLLAEASNFLSPTTTLTLDDASSRKRPSTLNSSRRTLSNHSDWSPVLPHEANKRNSGGLAFSPFADSMPSLSNSSYQAFSWGRRRAGSAHSSRTGSAPSASSAARTSGGHLAANPFFPSSRPSTATPTERVYTEQPVSNARLSMDAVPRQRPNSGSTFFTAQASAPSQSSRFSGIFSSAMPLSDSPAISRPPTPDGHGMAPNVLFVVASLYEFNIDRARQEGGYPYLTYVVGEIFDVIGEKGELWLAINQDDHTRQVGWIWEKHFIKVSVMQ